MSKESEALNKIKLGYIFGQVAINEFALRENEREDFKVIENALKALEIMKKKRVNVDWLLETENVEEYNESLYDDLTREEYGLLKEVLL